MTEIAEMETPTGESMTVSHEDLSPAERAIIERVLAFSMEEDSNKPCKKENGLPLQYRKCITNMKMTKSNQKCTVCFSSFKQGEIIKQLPCKHIFHRDCAKSWLKINRNCPNCRMDLFLHFQELERNSELTISEEISHGFEGIRRKLSKLEDISEKQMKYKMNLEEMEAIEKVS